MGSDFHESFAQDAVEPPSERSTGIVFACVSMIAAYIAYPSLPFAGGFVALGLILALVSWVRPSLLSGLTRVWFKFGLLLHKIVNPIVMLLMFVVAIVPAGLLMQLVRDPLRKKPPKDTTTYWVSTAESERAEKSMRNQF